MAAGSHTVPQFTLCQVGPFGLPGLVVVPDSCNHSELQQMTEWVCENHGYVTAPGVFSWKNPALRDWFVLRWS